MGEMGKKKKKKHAPASSLSNESLVTSVAPGAAIDDSRNIKCTANNTHLAVVESIQYGSIIANNATKPIMLEMNENRACTRTPGCQHWRRSSS